MKKYEFAELAVDYQTCVRFGKLPDETIYTHEQMPAPVRVTLAKLGLEGWSIVMVTGKERLIYLMQREITE